MPHDQPSDPVVASRLRMRRFAAAMVAALALFAARAVASDLCIGDCNGDLQVRIDELILGMQVDLGTRTVDACPAIDCNRDSHLGIIIACEVLAVHNALEGCDQSSSDAVWMFIIPCRQCEPCVGLSVSELLQLVNGTIPGTFLDALLPDGVTVLQSNVELVGAACAACGCPQSGSPIFHVLVPRTDVDRMLAAGWSVQQ